MKKLLPILFILISTTLTYGQNYNINTMGSKNTAIEITNPIQTPKGYGAIKAQLINEGIFADTAAANAASFVKLNEGAQIMTQGLSNEVQVWYRKNGAWNRDEIRTRVLNGLSVGITGDSVQLGGNPLIKNTTIDASLFWLNSLSSGTHSTALGIGTFAAGLQAVGIGYGVTASGLNSLAWGSGAVASGPYSQSNGPNSLSTASYSLALGPTTDATATDATAIGHNSQATARGATALGANTVASQINTTILTNNSNDSGAVGIGTSTPDASSKLDITSSTKGLLIPRMTLSQRNAIVSPATALLIFQTNNTPGYYYYTGSAWVPLSTASVGIPISSLTDGVNANSLSVAGFTQTWDWQQINGSGLKLISTANASGATSSKILEILGSGSGANMGVTNNYGVSVSITKNTAGGGGTNNIAGYFNASGGDAANYAGIFDAGNVGIGTTAPAKKLHTVGTVRHATLGTASSDTTTYKPLGINSSGDLIGMTIWPGGSVSGANLYNSNGYLTADRRLVGDPINSTYGLRFDSLERFNITTFESGGPNSANFVVDPSAAVMASVNGNSMFSINPTEATLLSPNNSKYLQIRNDSINLFGITRRANTKDKYLVYDTTTKKISYTDSGGGGTNYWTLSGSNLYNNSGTKIGIGTSAPTALLDVNDGSNSVLNIDAVTGQYRIGNLNSGNETRITVDNSNEVDSMVVTSTDNIFVLQGGGSPLAKIRLGGNDLFSIDGSLRNALFDQANDLSVRGQTYADGLLNVNDAGTFFIGDANGDMHGTSISGDDPSQGLTYIANNGHTFTGNMAIGTTVDASYILKATGKTYLNGSIDVGTAAFGDANAALSINSTAATLLGCYTNGGAARMKIDQNGSIDMTGGIGNASFAGTGYFLVGLGAGTSTPNSTLSTTGSFSAAYIAKTANYTATASNYTIDCTANTFTISLPTAVGIAGRIYVIKNSGLATTITIDAAGSETIDGALTQSISVQYQSYTILSTGANWIII